MGIGKKLLDIIYPEEEDDEEIVELTSEDARQVGYEKPKRPSVTTAGNAKMVLFEPRSFDEAQEIARHLVDGRACIVNFHRIKKDYAQRIIDFLSGVVYSLKGSINKIDVNVYLCSPRNSDVAGEIDLDNPDL